MMSKNPQVSQPSNSALERLSILVGAWDIEIRSMSFEEDNTASERHPECPAPHPGRPDA
jgi:hypothetical protein